VFIFAYNLLFVSISIDLNRHRSYLINDLIFGFYRLVRLNETYLNTIEDLKARQCACADANNCCECDCDSAPSDCGRCAPCECNGNDRCVTAAAADEDENLSSCGRKSPRRKPSTYDCRNNGSIETRTCDSCTANVAEKEQLQRELAKTKELFNEQVEHMMQMLVDAQRNVESHMERLTQQHNKEIAELNDRLKTYETTKVRPEQLQLGIDMENADRLISRNMDELKRQLADIENGLKSGKPKWKPFQTRIEDYTYA